MEFRWPQPGRVHRSEIVGTNDIYNKIFGIFLKLLYLHIWIFTLKRELSGSPLTTNRKLHNSQSIVGQVFV